MKQLNIQNRLEELYPERIIVPTRIQEIPRGIVMVYILTYDDKAIIVGHGEYNRAKVIFDDKTQITPHIKAIFVRLYRLFCQGELKQFIIKCDNKADAKVIEKNLHENIGGNTREIPKSIQDALFNGISPDSTEYMVLKMALLSNYDGISDLKMWRRNGILNDSIWEAINKQLQLDSPKVKTS